ncbi:MAG: hypothetical protein PHI10_05040 [Dehalococcoidales bacterium]|nr:hypothetical protein [Dehalococcoidales bacterium]
MSTMDTVIAYSVGLMVVMVIMYVGPGLGEEISAAMPINASGDFADATTGAEIWGSNAKILGVVILIVFISLAIKSIMGMISKGSE